MGATETGAWAAKRSWAAKAREGERRTRSRGRRSEAESGHGPLAASGVRRRGDQVRGCSSWGQRRPPEVTAARKSGRGYAAWLVVAEKVGSGSIVLGPNKALEGR
ncbi:hypothetical protein NDU88_005911 [Pleurodeles waltl]|uniref:Uncharacterized protein n=1 Tax=Pleurodeles waltl TaxID=8319 RepID=A0AAV7WW19_PLEWA|nr:hypothetical protein NDU88_005911 [Pleurodeles waltl]